MTLRITCSSPLTGYGSGFQRSLSIAALRLWFSDTVGINMARLVANAVREELMGRIMDWLYQRRIYPLLILGDHLP